MLTNILQWSAIRGLGNSVPARASMALPFIGYFIIFNDEIQKILRPSIATGPNIDQPSYIVNLYTLYFGLMFFGLGSIIYQIFCSEVVKRFHDQHEYILKMSNTVINEELIVIISKIIKKNGSNFDDGKMEASLLIVSSDGFISEKIRNYILYRFYEFKNTSNPVMIFTSFLFYLLGFILIAIPSFNTTFKVGRHLLSFLSSST